MKKHLQRITKTKPFINKYNWEGIHFPSGKDDWKKLIKIMSQLLLMLCMLKIYIYPASASKHNSNREKQVILLMISNGKG